MLRSWTERQADDTLDTACGVYCTGYALALMLMLRLLLLMTVLTVLTVPVVVTMIGMTQVLAGAEPVMVWCWASDVCAVAVLVFVVMIVVMTC